jgi:hypothetical protein
MMQGPGHLDHATVTRSARSEEMTASVRASNARRNNGPIARFRSHLGNGLIQAGNRVIPKPSERLSTAGPPC